MSFLHEILVDMLSGPPTVSLVIHLSQLLWRVSSLDSWILDKAHNVKVSTVKVQGECL